MTPAGAAFVLEDVIDPPQRCGTCRFYESPSIIMDNCRRHAPVTCVTAYEHEGRRLESRHAAFPIVPATGWCGDYEARV